MDHEKLLLMIRKRPEMVLVDGSFRGYCAFLYGVNAGSDGHFLEGFREFLVTRFGGANNLTWHGLVIRLAFPKMDTGFDTVLDTPENDQHAVDTLFTLLEEFQQRRTTGNGLLDIYDEYLTWLKAQSWYRPPSGRR